MSNSTPPIRPAAPPSRLAAPPIRLAEQDAEIAGCFPVMLELRPLLVAEDFVARVRSQQRNGYRLAYLEVGERVVAATGFRVLETLVDGRCLHVDDLVTLASERSRGYGEALLSWLCERASQEQCGSVQLDSGHFRVDAHRFYEREGMENSALHFKKMVGAAGALDG